MLVYPSCELHCSLKFLFRSNSCFRPQELHLTATKLYNTFAVAAVPEDLQNQEGLGQEGQAEQTYPTVDQIQDRQQNQVTL